MRYTNPHIEAPLDLGVLGMHVARVTYNLDHLDVDYIIVDAEPLYLEIEPTTLDQETQDAIASAIQCDAAIRRAQSAENAADARADAASFERTEMRAA